MDELGLVLEITRRQSEPGGNGIGDDLLGNGVRFFAAVCGRDLRPRDAGDVGLPHLKDESQELELFGSHSGRKLEYSRL